MKDCPKKFLLESDVIDAVCKFLNAHGYTTRQHLSTTEKGDDIIVVMDSPPPEIHIEAKGETSSRKNSKKFGEPFNGSQIRHHVAMAIYKCAEVLSRKDTDIEVRVGMALPGTSGHRTAVEQIIPALEKLGINVFWVDRSGKVEGTL